MKRTLSFLLIGVLFFTSLSYGSELTEILNKSVGGDKAVEQIKRLKSIYLSGRVNLNGSIGRFESKIKYPDKFYLSLDFEKFSMAQGYDGEIAWQKNMTGQKTELTGSEKNEVLNTLYMSNFRYLF